MASAIKNLRVDNDSVVYEHIIPRTARQKWVRRASTDYSGLNVDVHHRSFGIDNDFMDSIVSHDVQDESDDKQVISNDLNHMGPQEEVAVFNAWGIKLRHINKWKESISRNSEFQKEIYSERTDMDLNGNANNDDKKDVPIAHLASRVKDPPAKTMNNDLHDNNESPNHSDAVKEASLKIKRQRPMSMPVMTFEGLKENNPSNKFKQSPPKAYKSPNSKVPWKRVIETRKSTSRINDEVDKNTKSNSEPFNSSSESNDIQVNRGKDLNNINGNKSINGTNLNNKQIIETVNLHEAGSKQLKISQDMKDPSEGESETLISVVKRRESFEMLDEKENRSHPSNHVDYDKNATDSVNLKKREQNVSNKVNNKKNNKDTKNTADHSSYFAKQQSVSPSVNLVTKHNTEKILKENYHASNSPVKEAVVNYTYHQNRKVQPNIYDQENNDKETMTQFGKAPSKNLLNENKSEIIAGGNNHKSPKAEQKESKNEKSREDNEVSNNLVPHDFSTRSTDISKNKGKEVDITSDSMPVTTITGHNRRIGNLLIQSGDLRERQIKTNKQNINSSHQNSNETNKKDEWKYSRSSVTNKSNSDKEKPELFKKEAIPVTNIDDIKDSAIAEKVTIPVTNLDELIAPSKIKKQHLHLSCSNKHGQNGLLTQEDNYQSSAKQHFCPVKKVNYYEGRELITPKIICERPVGLKSAISPKGKKNAKVLKVSFSTDKLEKLHMYPSESAATEMFDETNKQGLDDIPVHLDSFLDMGHCGDLASYKSDSFANLESTIEHERKKLSAASIEKKTKTDELSDTTADVTTNFGGEGDHFTESTISTASAILF